MMDTGRVSRDSAWKDKCPNQLKGEACHVCGGQYLCLQPWRKKRTAEQRKAAYKADQKENRQYYIGGKRVIV